jgi:nucleoside-diphosphate-sugar epimerase
VGDNTVVPIFLNTLPGKTAIPIGDLSARTDMVFAPNMAFSLVLAAEQLEPGVAWSGTPFHITDHETVNVQRFLADLVAPLGYRTPDRVRVPQSVASSLARFYETRYRLSRMERFARPVLTVHKLLLSTTDYWLDSGRARTVLGYKPPVSRADAIATTQEWLLATAGRVDTGKG